MVGFCKVEAVGFLARFDCKVEVLYRFDCKVEVLEVLEQRLRFLSNACYTWRLGFLARSRFLRFLSNAEA